MSIVADFVGGPLDGQTYHILNEYEWKVPFAEPLNPWDCGSVENLDKPLPVKVVVYRHIVNGIFWMNRIEEFG